MGKDLVLVVDDDQAVRTMLGKFVHHVDRSVDTKTKSCCLCQCNLHLSIPFR